MNREQFEKMRDGRGFIAALDQSGGSTPKALKNYGIGENAYSNDEEMFRVVHEMRTRIITSPAFNGDRILAAILFEDTMNREIEGRPSADYLWNVKQVVPIIKIDKGLAEEADAVQVMKPMPGLDDLLSRAVDKGFFGTKERSFIVEGNEKGVQAVAAQQFEVGKQVADAGLVPILEPEVSIKASNKAEAETTRMSSAWWPSPAATPVRRRTPVWPATRAWWPASPGPSPRACPPCRATTSSTRRSTPRSRASSTRRTRRFRARKQSLPGDPSCSWRRAAVPVDLR